MAELNHAIARLEPIEPGVLNDRQAALIYMRALRDVRDYAFGSSVEVAAGRVTIDEAWGRLLELHIRCAHDEDAIFRAALDGEITEATERERQRCAPTNPAAAGGERDVLSRFDDSPPLEGPVFGPGSPYRQSPSEGARERDRLEGR